jgi:hypothetical protein
MFQRILMQDAKTIGEYDETPEIAFIKEYLDDNLVNIIGGCWYNPRTYQVDC